MCVCDIYIYMYIYHVCFNTCIHFVMLKQGQHMCLFNYHLLILKILKVSPSSKYSQEKDAVISLSIAPYNV